jgi:N-acetylneuraminic acid mutarotase
MKKTFEIQALTFFSVCMIIFCGCRKEPGIPIVKTTEASSITTTTVSTGGLVTSDGGSDVTSRGLCWSNAPFPTIDNSKIAVGAGTGSFSIVLSGLTENTTYYARAYAINKAGTGYGNEISFTTVHIVIPASLPIITTTMVTSIMPNSAVTGGTISSDGGDSVIARGVCLGTKIDPTINDFNTVEGSGEGSFTSNLTGLSPNRTYFVRAYAINSAGTAYGTQFSFTTPVNENNAGSQKANFPGNGRYGASAFSIGSRIYMGLGYNDIGSSMPTRDFWELDPATNVWTKKADYPGNSGANAVSFSIGTKGYIGTGSAISFTNYTNEFWEYDPARNSWSQKESLTSTPARAWAVGFSIGNKGYIGTGSMDGAIANSYYKEFWEWDQATNVWTRKADFEGSARGGSVGFSIGNKGYIGTGSDGNSTLFRDFWEWDQATNQWTRKADFGGASRSGAVGFSIGNKGYIGTGLDITSAFNDFWEWDPQTNTWRRSSDFQGSSRAAAVGLSSGGKVYIGTGSAGNAVFDDFWEYNP